ncbi:hypothetical protein L6Q96_21920 [Candidatus Binatia bacterium]|nr:hypothetical protein [Candidatus Binatia bacterium]
MLSEPAAKVRGTAHVLVLVAALTATLLAGVSRAGVEETAECEIGIAPDTARVLFDILNHPAAEPDCKFEGLGTHQTWIEALWSRGGTPLPPLSAAPAACASTATRRAGAFAVEVPPELTQSCPSIAPRIAAFLDALAAEQPGAATGSVSDPLFRFARLLFVAITVVALVILLRRLRQSRRCDAYWVAVGVVGFLVAVGVRAALPFSLGNWYAEVLPAIGPPPWMRFGPGYFALQALLRDLGVWGPRGLAVSQIFLGALAVPLLVGVLRELRVNPVAAAASALLLIVAPFHARLSATPSEHVLASTLCIGLLLSWLIAARGGDRLWLAMAVLLFPAVCVTRVDMAVPAAAPLLWPLLRDRIEREDGLHGRALWWRAAVMATAAAAALAVTYRFVALPSHHPFPQPEGHALAARLFVWQFWSLATTDPRWLPLPAALLALIGAAAMTVRRPLLLLRVFLTLLLSFVGLGRLLTTDELLGARYFLFAIAIFLILPGYGFAALPPWVPPRYRTAVTAAGLAALAVWSGVDTRSAYAVRYAFEDEYAFLRRALAALPAGCRVYQVPLRSAAYPRDLDCCLDIGRSPLLLDYPDLQFASVPRPATSAFDDRPGCLAYYEGAACRIADDPLDSRVHERAERAADDLRRRCNEVRAVGRLELVAETTTSPRATVNFFHGAPPQAGLYRWTP